ncbi:MAG TPA: AAA family ATPase [Nocardioides sp.]|nr:AAA family ATPase [Nocardioides sp.]
MAARSSPVMIGRDGELDELADLLGISGGDSANVLLSGDAGVGKTRLLMALRDRAVAAGWQVHAGACLDFGESALPYLPFSVVVGRFAAEQPELLARVVASHPALDRLQPGHRMAPGEKQATDRAALFTGVHALLDEAAADAPVLLVIEDAHWADQSTRDLLGFLFARQYAGTVAIVASYRTEDLHRRHPLRRQVAEWARLPEMSRLSLAPLPDRAVRQLVAELAPTPFGAERTAAIVRRAEGNAFFVEELVASECGGECLPGDLADVLLVGLDRLTDEGREVVRLASVAGRRVGHELLAAASTLPPEEFEAGVRAAVEMNLLEAGASAYSFRHALLAEAVYDDLLPGERVRLHQQYVAALTSGATGTAAELARHAWRARDLDRAVIASIAAGDEAMSVGGPDDAAGHYENALELLADGDRAERLGIDVATIVLRASDAQTASGDAQRAVALLAQQLATPAGSVESRVRMLASYADLLSYVESGIDPADVSSEAVALAPEGTAVRAEALATHAELLAKRVTMGDASSTQQAEMVATEALALAERLGLGGVVSAVIATLSRLREGPADLRRALRDAVHHAEMADALRPELRARFLLARSHQDEAEWDEAEEWYRSVLARGQGQDWAPYVLDARWQLGIIRWIRGEWVDALELVTVGRVAPPVPRGILAPTRLSIQHARGGDVIEELVALRALWPDEGAIAVFSAGAELEVYADAADADAALDLHGRVTGLLTEIWQPRFPAGVRLAAQTLAAIAAALPTATGVERARLATEGARVAEDGRMVVKAHDWGIEGRFWQARLAAEDLRVRWLAGEDPPTREELVAAWDLAVERADAMGHVTEGARVRASYASILRQLGDREEARRHADAARVTAQQLGWVRLTDALTASGAAPSRTAAQPGRLTERETEILALVAEGRTNGEIGKQLFISTKTVSVHVSNILGKLGASGRTEAAAIARRDGLVGGRG